MHELKELSVLYIDSPKTADTLKQFRLARLDLKYHL